MSIIILVIIIEMTIYFKRTEKKMTLVELSKKTGISKSALQYYESNIRFPNMLQMEKLAIALEVPITDLFNSEYK